MISKLRKPRYTRQAIFQWQSWCLQHTYLQYDQYISVWHFEVLHSSAVICNFCSPNFFQLSFTTRLPLQWCYGSQGLAKKLTTCFSNRCMSEFLHLFSTCVIICHRCSFIFSIICQPFPPTRSFWWATGRDFSRVHYLQLHTAGLRFPWRGIVKESSSLHARPIS